jgi:hypothetical protein
MELWRPGSGIEQRNDGKIQMIALQRSKWRFFPEPDPFIFGATQSNQGEIL